MLDEDSTEELILEEEEPPLSRSWKARLDDAVSCGTLYSSLEGLTPQVMEADIQDMCDIMSNVCGQFSKRPNKCVLSPS